MNSSNGNRRNHDEALKGALQYWFITTRKFKVDVVANALNMEYNDLYAYVSGQRTMPPTLLVKMTIVIGDTIFLDTILAGTNMGLNVLLPHKHGNNIITEGLEAFAAAGEIAGELKTLVSGGSVPQDVRLRMQKKVTETIQELRDVADLISKSFTPTV